MNRVPPAFLRLKESHQIVKLEGGLAPGADPEGGMDAEPMPGYWVVQCKCGWRFRSYYGEDLADEASQRHLFQMLHEIQLTPGGGNVNPRQ